MDITNLTLNRGGTKSLIKIKGEDHKISEGKTSCMDLVHPPDELIDVIFAVASITAFNVVVSLLLQTAKGCLELKWPEEVVCLLEVGSNSQDLMDKVLHANDSMLTQSL
jgi:hypothetical protein